jgi:hypothetical protein
MDCHDGQARTEQVTVSGPVDLALPDFQRDAAVRIEPATSRP